MDPHPARRRRRVALCVLLGAALVNPWVLARLPLGKELLDLPPWYALAFAWPAFWGIFGLFLLIPRRLPLARSRGVRALAPLLALGVSAWAGNHAYRGHCPYAVDRLEAWRGGSSMWAAPDSLIDWVGAYAARLEKDPSRAIAATRTHAILGDYLLRIGRIEEALAHFHRAYDLGRREGVPEKALDRIRRSLAVGYLREGEINQCVRRNTENNCIFPLHDDGLWRNSTASGEARRWLEEILEHDPNQYGVRWLLNFTYMADGLFPDGVPEAYRLPPSATAPDPTAPHFRNIAMHLGVDDFTLSGGAVMDDFDGDGLLDLIASSYERTVSLSYHHNLGNGQFEDWTERCGLEDQRGGLNIVQADYDNDGDLDLLVLRGAWMGVNGRDRNSLLRQEADHSFTDVTEEAGLGAPDWPCLAAAWADYDNDGDLDLYIGNERLSGHHYAPSQLFQNDGHGHFTDVAKQAGVTNDRHTRGVSWGDYDRDGDLDLYLSNMYEPNRLYRNNGDGSFTDVGPELGVIHNGGRDRSFGAWFFDVDNDGWLDIFSASYPLIDSVDAPAAAYFGDSGDQERCRLWRNDGQGGFEDVSADYGLDRMIISMASNYGDVDNDGWMDFYLSTGGPPFEALVPNILFHNREGKRFVDASASSGLGHLQKGHGVAFGDLDNDGDLDLYCEMGGWYLDGRFANALFENEGTPNHVLVIRPRGVKSNRFGIGTTVRARIEEGGREREVWAEVGSGASFGGNSLQLELGIGKATMVKRLDLWWPASGIHQIVKDLPADSCVEIVEGEAGFHTLSYPRLQLAG